MHVNEHPKQPGSEFSWEMRVDYCCDRVGLEGNLCTKFMGPIIKAAERTFRKAEAKRGARDSGQAPPQEEPPRMAFSLPSVDQMAEALKQNFKVTSGSPLIGYQGRRLGRLRF